MSLRNTIIWSITSENNLYKPITLFVLEAYGGKTGKS